MAVISLNAHQVFASILTTKTVLANVFEVIGFKMVKKIVPMDPMRVSGYILLIYFCVITSFDEFCKGDGQKSDVRDRLDLSALPIIEFL